MKSSRWFFFLMQFFLIFGLIEISLRILAPHWPFLNALLYIPSLRTKFHDETTLKGLMTRTADGYHPFDMLLGDRLNSRSFRTKEYAETPARDTSRIVVLGDSFSYTSGKVILKEMWYTHLEKELQEKTRKTIEVISLGVDGVGPMFELRLWNLEGSKLRPDLVVLAFFVGNDFTDEQKDGITPYRWNVILKHVATVRLVRNLGRYLGEVSKGYRVGEGRNPRSSADEAMSDIVVPDSGTFSVDRYRTIEAARLALCLKSNRSLFESLSNKIDQVLMQLNSEVRQSRSQLMVMIIPDEFQINDQLRHDVLAFMGRTEQDVDILLPQRHLAQLFESNNIPFIDLEPLIREHSKSQSLYWLRDTHWNIAGNRLAASALAEKILDLGLLKSN